MYQQEHTDETAPQAYVRRTPQSILVLLASALLIGCGSGETTPAQQATESESPFAVSVELPTPSVEFATGFQVQEGPGYRLVSVVADPSSVEETANRSWTEGADRMVLVPRGSTPSLPPELEALPRFEVPVSSIATNRDADALRVKVLGALDRLRGIGGTAIYDEDIHAGVVEGRIGSIGSALHRTTNIEFLLTAGIEAALFRVASLEHADQFNRIREVGVPAAPMFDWAERSYLGRAEWLKYVAMFLGADDEADRVFEAMVAKRDSLVDLADGVPSVPVIWAFRSGDRWMVHRNSLESELLQDAGGRNVLADLTAGVTDGDGGFSEGVPMTDEEFLIAAQAAEY